MAQDWEMWLRKEIYWADTMKDDKVVEARLYLPYHAVDTGWGIEEERVGDPTKGEAYVWKSPFVDMEDEFEELDLKEYIKTPESTWTGRHQTRRLSSQKTFLTAFLKLSSATSGGGRPTCRSPIATCAVWRT